MDATLLRVWPASSSSNVRSKRIRGYRPHRSTYFETVLSVCFHRRERPALLESIKAVDGNILKRLSGSVGPPDFDFIDVLVLAQAKVQPQIVLRKITPSAAHLVHLPRLPCRNPDAGIQRQAILQAALEIKADPMIGGITLRFKNHRGAGQVFDHNVEPSPVEEIAYRKAPTHLRNAHCLSRLRAYILEGPVSQILKDQLGLFVMNAQLCAVNLGIDVSVHQNHILPA